MELAQLFEAINPTTMIIDTETREVIARLENLLELTNNKADRLRITDRIEELRNEARERWEAFSE